MKTFKESIEKFQHDKIVSFKNDIKKYKIPKGFRMYNGIDLYQVALKQLDDYFKKKLSLKDIQHPDKELRNVMMLWHNDKKKI